MSSKLYHHLRKKDAGIKIIPATVKCVTASGHDLDIIGQTKFSLKVGGFSWKWEFLVSRRLIGCPILGVDFIKENRMVLDLGQGISAKLLPRYKGPFKIEAFLTPVTARLVDPTSGEFVTRSHVTLLKPATARKD